MKIEPKLVSIKQFADLSGLSVRTLERLDAAGRLPKRIPIPGPSGKLMRVKRWSYRSVCDWIQRNASAVKVAI